METKSCFELVGLQNAPSAGLPSIAIKPTDAQWLAAYKAWLAGENPTDSAEWKKGVFLVYVNVGDGH